MTRTLAPCGTPPAYQVHLRRGEPACDSCRMARALYQELWRWDRETAAGRAARARQVLRRGQALTILGRRHPVELAQIVDDLLTAELETR